MSAKGAPNIPQTDAVPVQDESLATNQEIVPVPLWWGTRKIAARWISPATLDISVEVNDATTKK